MKRLLALVLVLTFVSVGLCAVDKTAIPVKKPVVKVGVILPLSGDLSFFGEVMRNSALLKLEELKKQPTKFEYKFIFEDSHGEMKTALLAANRLTGWDKVDFLIGFWGDASMVVLPVAKRAGIPHLAVMAWTPKVLGDSPLNFNIATSPERETGLILKVFKGLGYKKIAVLYLRSLDLEHGHQYLIDELKRQNMEVVADIPFVPGEREFLPHLWKIKEAKPEVLINFSVAPEMFIIEKRFKELGLTCAVTAFDGTYDGNENYEYIQGHWYVTCAQPTAEFSKKYEAKYGRAPEYGSGFMYDAVNLTTQAFEEASSGAHKPRSQEIAAWLKKVKAYKGAVGELNCDERGYIDTFPKLMKIVKGKPVETTVEEIVKAHK